MPVPHDYYDYDSDVPHLHNRDHARPYVEPDWQAHAAGHQLPVLSTIGRGPQGDGLLVANIVNDGRSFSFDIISDVTGEPIAKIGPVPSGAVHVTHDEDSITFTTNKLGPNNTIATEVTKVDMPRGEAGSIVYLYPDQLERNSSDVYVLDAEKMVAYNRRGLNRRPDMKVDDIVIGQLKDGNDGYLFFGTVVNADSQQAIMVAGQTFIPIAALMGPRGPKGETGGKGDPGEKGDDGAPGISPVCSWNGTVLTITDGTGPHSMDLKGETGQTGQTGADGKSAYQVAIDNGYRGSQADWLADLKGPKGDNGAPGATGPQGIQGIPGDSFVTMKYTCNLSSCAGDIDASQPTELEFRLSSSDMAIDDGGTAIGYALPIPDYIDGIICLHRWPRSQVDPSTIYPPTVDFYSPYELHYSLMDVTMGPSGPISCGFKLWKVPIGEDDTGAAASIPFTSDDKIIVKVRAYVSELLGSDQRVLYHSSIPYYSHN